MSKNYYVHYTGELYTSDYEGADSDHDYDFTHMNRSELK